MADEGLGDAALPATVAVPVTQMAEDEVAGFEALFASERVAMIRLAYLLVGSEAQAEELVQDAFATVFVRWRKLENPGGFLRRCVVNGAKSSLRRRILERRRATALVDEGTSLQARELLDALGSLPLEWRAVVVLRFYEGMSQQEIADALGLRLGTVKSRLHRGLAKLREEIEP